MLAAAHALLIKLEREATFDADLSSALSARDHGELVKLLQLADTLLIASADMARGRDMVSELELAAVDAVERTAGEHDLEGLQQALKLAAQMKLESPVLREGQATLENMLQQEKVRRQLQEACEKQSTERE